MSFPEGLLPQTGLGASDVNVSQIISDAGNMPSGTNPPYTIADFLGFYPQFGSIDEAGTVTGPVPKAVIQAYLTLANASVIQARWLDAWSVGMANFIAHFCELYLMASTPTGASAKAVVAAGEARGLKTGKSAGDVSVNVDFNAIAQDLGGWAAWKLTIYGQQFATMGKLMGMGGAVVL